MVGVVAWGLRTKQIQPPVGQPARVPARPRIVHTQRPVARRFLGIRKFECMQEWARVIETPRIMMRLRTSSSATHWKSLMWAGAHRRLGRRQALSPTRAIHLKVADQGFITANTQSAKRERCRHCPQQTTHLSPRKDGHKSPVAVSVRSVVEHAGRHQLRHGPPRRRQEQLNLPARHVINGRVHCDVLQEFHCREDVGEGNGC